MNTEYFTQLNSSLKNYNRSIPFLIVDLDMLDQNIAALRQQLTAGHDFRLVVKSLPVKGLLDYINETLGQERYMVFHQPFLSDIAKTASANADILMGKPMPAKTVRYFFDTLPDNSSFDAARQIQWLADTELRLYQYLGYAQETGRCLRVNLELDVGLHRGGFASLDALGQALTIIREHPDQLSLAGFMGYDPHVVKLPKWLKSQSKALSDANTFYKECKDYLKEHFPDLYNNNLVFNGAGSPTIKLHNTPNSPLNEVSAGSCLVKPTTFDIPTLSEFRPASFIATPVLKHFENTSIPGLERMKGVLSTVKSDYKRSAFIYGGFWKADYVFPDGTEQNDLFGASTNQTMVNLPTDVDTQVDDFVFLRPHQSEYVFLHFGRVLTVRDGQIVGEWDLLDNNV